MSDQELNPLPKGLLKTVAYTQLCEAIKKDFGIELPMKKGKETARAVGEMLGVRTPDPMLEELAGALHKLLNFTAGEWLKTMDDAEIVLKKYQQSKVES